ncbi:MAG: 3-deoxy-7-phosphoheptulonate synthase [Gammaproteobacteria bacterium]|nr:3-deoxy-7-phosphoheptulonate synthase [Gammaproteobacteria bacterium]
MPARHTTEDLRIREIREVSSPQLLHQELPLGDAAAKTVVRTRTGIADILHGRDDRLLVVAGPCSIHDPAAALEYAQRLRAASVRYAAELLLVMRVYFEKPRTTVGWKGLINDPGLDGSFDINRGLRLARQLLLDLNNVGMPAATEFLDLVTPQYIADLVSWGAIGARTTESQVHRELASGLSCPVGFKNGTDGTLRIAVDAIRSASEAHHFLSLTMDGHSAIFSTTGNGDCHVILRGGRRPNFDTAAVEEACQQLMDAELVPRVMIDFSHANSGKQFQRQLSVGANVSAQVAGGETRIIGTMIESHLEPGRQDVVPGRPLAHGVSITDACLGWADTEPLLAQLADAVQRRRRNTR